MGFGMIIHDDNGDFVACRLLVIPGVYRVEVGEAMGLLEALSWLKEFCLQRVKVETNAKLVVDAMKSTSGVVSFIKRVLNEKTHRIARLTMTFSNHHSWIEQSNFMIGI
ncbi:hypothetical protein ACS0TY_011553 [Phlomoides rotata]